MVWTKLDFENSQFLLGGWKGIFRAPNFDSRHVQRAVNLESEIGFEFP